MPLEFIKIDTSNICEDCLYLNVWTPASTTLDSFPVMVWIHGGGFFVGASSEEIYDATTLAYENVVVVTLTYRLGVFGFLADSLLSAESNSASSGNYGLMDQVIALNWVN